MIFHIEINYKKGPTFSTRVQANCAEIAKTYAVQDARRFGMAEKIKKITVRKEQ